MNLEKVFNQIDTRLPKGDMSGILLRECNWSVTTAGPSPFNNQRTELFLLGCNKAMSGNACKGCFNSTTWDNSTALWSHDPVKMAEHINNNAPNKYITIGGGEPTDQLDNLIILCKELKKYGFHIMMYTWRNLMYELTPLWMKPKPYSLKVLPTGQLLKLLRYIDIVVDGDFKLEQRLWDGTKGDGLLSSIGSGNQRVFDIKHMLEHQEIIYYPMKDLVGLYIKPDTNELVYITKE